MNGGQATGRVFLKTDDQEHWIKVQASAEPVGQSQPPAEEPLDDAPHEKKATARKLGPVELGHRFNAIITVSVPLQQHIDGFSEQIDFHAERLTSSFLSKIETNLVPGLDSKKLSLNLCGIQSLMAEEVFGEEKLFEQYVKVLSQKTEGRKILSQEDRQALNQKVMDVIRQRVERMLAEKAGSQLARKVEEMVRIFPFLLVTFFITAS